MCILIFFTIISHFNVQLSIIIFDKICKKIKYICNENKKTINLYKFAFF
jgi:hypothetical protein